MIVDSASLRNLIYFRYLGTLYVKLITLANSVICSVTSRGWGRRRYPPYVFTAQGVAMLSSVLNSKRAIQVNIEIMRAFVRLRKMLAGHEKLASKIEKLEKKYDAQFKEVFEVIHHLMTPPDKKSRKIGFRKEE